MAVKTRRELEGELRKGVITFLQQRGKSSVIFEYGQKQQLVKRWLSIFNPSPFLRVERAVQSLTGGDPPIRSTTIWAVRLYEDGSSGYQKEVIDRPTEKDGQDLSSHPRSRPTPDEEYPEETKFEMIKQLLDDFKKAIAPKDLRKRKRKRRKKPWLDLTSQEGLPSGTD